MGNRANLIARLTNLDLSDTDSLYRERDMLIELFELGGVGFGGTKFYLDPVNGDDSNTGLGADNAVQTLAVAYALLTANLNDMLYLIGGASSIAIPSGFVWAKNFTHLIGLASSLRHGGRARLGHTTDFTPIFPITASGCQFANIHIQHGRGNVANLVNTYLTGSRNSFINVHWEGPLHVTEAAAAYRQLVFGTSAEANSFFGCSIGAWSVQGTGANGREIEFLGNASDTVFENCIIRCMNDTAGHEMVEASAGVGDGSITIEFDGCKFIQHDSSQVLTKVFEEPTNGFILLNNCTTVRVTAMSGDDTKVLLSRNVIV